MKRRTPLSHKIVAPTRVSGESEGNLTALPAADKLTDTESLKQLILCDLTLSNRVGFRGRNIDSWLQKTLDIDAPPINQACHTEQGILVMRLSPTEVLLQEDMHDGQDAITRLLEKTSTGPIMKFHPDIYYLPRRDSHACFMIRGNHCAQLFSKLCALDLRYHKFSDMCVTQTLIARVGAIIVRRNFTEIPGYLVLTESSLAEYLWDCMVDAMQEFAGRAYGF